MSELLHDLIVHSACRAPHAEALSCGNETMTYETLRGLVAAAAGAFLDLGALRSDRIAVYMEKRMEAVVATFGAAAAGAVFVPVNPLLKPEQVLHILRDCGVRVLVTTHERLLMLGGTVAQCPELRHVMVVGLTGGPGMHAARPLHDWGRALGTASARAPHRVIDHDIAAILYTSGSTGKPKGVVLSHRNMVAGARSVAQYLHNGSADRILAVLPLSFDAGFSQLTTAFHAGARVTLLNHLLPRDVIDATARERITGITAVPPLWIQLAQQTWPPDVDRHLRYIANTGGRMPRGTLERLRELLPRTSPYLMYGLTESFRSTYLPPAELDRRPDSIGRAIPNAEVLVVREDGTPCAPGEPGELVHRGALVSLGYWNDPQKTAERFRPVPHPVSGLTMPEMAVWSGDTVKMDDEGYLYFIGRRDEMIKTSGYRVSPTEIEEVIYSTGMVTEAAAIGVPHPALGQVIAVIATARGGESLDTDALIAQCRRRLPAYMVPARVRERTEGLPRNPNGKIDRARLAAEMQAECAEQE